MSVIIADNYGVTRRNRSPGQMAMHQRLAWGSHLLSPLRDFLAMSFCHKGNRHGYHRAMSYLIKHAFSGQYPGLRFHYERLLLSEGFLPGESVEIAGLSNNELVLRWPLSTEPANVRELDIAVGLVFSERMGTFLVMNMQRQRRHGTIGIKLPLSLGADTLHVYCCFLGVNGRQASRSEYLGRISTGSGEIVQHGAA